MESFTHTGTFHRLPKLRTVQSVLSAFVLAVVVAPVALGQITIPTVPIGNPGNAPDTRVMTTDGTSGYGSVAYTYNIGRYEVTNAQYAAFLNAVAATDTNNLYNPDMGGPFGGINRFGSPGSYTYSPIPGRENHTVNWVSFWDATRFANWLHNLQPTGLQDSSTTEDGAYTLTVAGISANTITRNSGARWALPSENEWYKVAYNQPASIGGDADDYWLYPTSSNATPNAGQANFWSFPDAPTMMPAGSYAANFYGAFDMGGNILEWNEAISNQSRGVRGGSWRGFSFLLRADERYFNFAPFESDDLGFRVSRLAVAPCPADVNGDRLVNAADLSFFLGVFGVSTANFPSAVPADFNGDGVVNAADLSILLANFGQSC